MSDEKLPGPNSRGVTLTIYEDYCKGCEICTQLCPTDVLVMSDRLGRLGYFVAEVARLEDCPGCRWCVIACPDFAIKMEKIEPAKDK